MKTRTLITALCCSLLLLLAGTTLIRAQESEEPKKTESTPAEGSDEGAEEEPGIAEVKDNWALYRKKGRKWKHKSVTTIEGMDPMISYIEYGIIEVGDDYCVQTMLMLDGEGEPFPGMDAEEIRIEFGDRSDMEGTDGEEYEIETIKVEAGEFECYLLDFGDTKSWTAVDYPGLLVKSDDGMTSVELIEFSDGDDDEKDTSSEPAPEEGEGKKADMSDYWERYVSTFKKGRSWTLKMAAGITLKTEVISVDEEKAVVKSTSYMNGNVIGEPTETDYSLVEPKEDPEDAEQLEWTEKEITVEAGTFMCISPDGKTWLMKKHPLIVVKTPAMELVEFNE